MFGLVWSIMELGKSMITNQLDYVALIINYLEKRSVGRRGGSISNIWLFIFEASN